jgi:transposase
MLLCVMRPLSLDLRERIILALQSGQTRPEIAERFSISVSTVGRLAKQWREQNDLSPRPITGRPRAIPDAERERLQTLITTQKDATLESLSQALQEQTGRKISISALQRNLIWLSYSYKKSRGLPKSETPRSAPPSWKR